MKNQDLYKTNEKIVLLENERASYLKRLPEIEVQLQALYNSRKGEAVPGTYCVACGKNVVTGPDPRTPNCDRMTCDGCFAEYAKAKAPPPGPPAPPIPPNHHPVG